MSLRALIFDVDGTLADSEEAHRQAFNAAFAENGLPWRWGRLVYCELLKVAGGRERIAHFVGLLDIPERDKSVLRRQIPAIQSCKTRHYARLVAEGRVPLRDGVERLIAEARAAGLRLAIASTTSRANIDALLAHALGQNAVDWFEVIAASDFGGRKKPAADIYEFVLVEMGLRAADCIAFEDSAIGLAAAKGAGLYTVVTPTFWTAEADLSAANLVLTSLRDGGDLAALSSPHSDWYADQMEAA
jgi:HAD superfamily hydrolase (TIGR01509 family)